MAEPPQPQSRAGRLLGVSNPDQYVHLVNAQAANRVRSGLVFGMLGLFALTALGAFLGAFFGSSGRWNQLSPVVDTVLAIEAAALGSAVAYYMAKQD